MDAALNLYFPIKYTLKMFFSCCVSNDLILSAQQKAIKISLRLILDSS